MEKLARRRFLTLLLGVGTAAACGMNAASTADAQTAAATPAAAPAEAIADTEAALEPNQFFIVRRRRIRRRVFYIRPRRRVYYVRPRRVFVVRRRPRFYRVRRFRR